jgi:hypothetical protein
MGSSGLALCSPGCAELELAVGFVEIDAFFMRCLLFSYLLEAKEREASSHQESLQSYL